MIESHTQKEPIESSSPEKLNTSCILHPTSVEFFFSGIQRDSTLPPEISSHPVLLEQAALRRDLSTQLSTIFSKIPNATETVTTALKSGKISEREIESLYLTLSSFLEMDENNYRILLYLPFEILPDMRTRDFEDTDLANATKHFAETYRLGWIRLLHELEPRANYTDGDILEPGLPLPERISKAGHLTPELLEKGIISIEDVLALLELIEEKEFLVSLAEGVTVSNDKGLLDTPSWEKAKGLIATKIGELSVTSIEKAYMYDPTSSRISPERARWLKKIKKEKNDDQEAKSLSQQIIEGTLPQSILIKGLPPKSIALGIIKAGKSLHKHSPDQAKEYARQVENTLDHLWNSQDLDTQDALISGLNHWSRLGIISPESFQKFICTITDLSSPIPYDENEFEDEFKYFTLASEKIRNHPVLSRVLFPTFLLFGSRLKGYADKKSDLDAAIFFRPEAVFEDREKIIELLNSDIPELENKGGFLEYWTQREQNKISLKNPEQDTRIFVGEDQIHFFMGGAWIGDEKETTTIRNQLLEQYVDLSRFGPKKRSKRQQFLGQLELDTLQYRLLHKGFRKFYPQTERIYSEHSNLIDATSDFWDPAYRRIATKLFLGKVFLPDLS